MDLNARITNSTLAFRGYNVTNIGKSPELLEHPEYGPLIEPFLREASEICSEITEKKVNLAQRIRDRKELELEDYAESISMIVAMEQAQLHLLRHCFDVDYKRVPFVFGFSLGEISALIACGVYKMKDALRIPLAMSADGIDLAQEVALGILFSRGELLPLGDVHKLFVEINMTGNGVIGMSTVLSPNSILILGTGDTLDRFQERLKEIMPKGLHLRRNKNRWPPLHTPIVWERNITSRAAFMLHTLPGGLTAPEPPILSLVTGENSYNESNSRELITKWIDHPQQLWEVVCTTLARKVQTIIHVGPEPNIIPATFDRLAANVESQTKGSRSMRALSAVIRRPWLQKMLPKRASLLRATMVEHVILEDWLLKQKTVQ